MSCQDISWTQSRTALSLSNGSQAGQSSISSGGKLIARSERGYQGGWVDLADRGLRRRSWRQKNRKLFHRGRAATAAIASDRFNAQSSLSKLLSDDFFHI